jgi:hypothetical protein
MRDWLTARTHIPAGTRALLTEVADGERAKLADVDLSGVRAGSAPALARLEQMEVRLHKLLQAAIKSGNPMAIKVAREDWVAVSDSLRRFDLLVAREARVSQDMIPRATVERHVTAFITVLRLAGTQSVNALAPQFANTPAQVADTLAPVLQEQILNALSVLGTTDNSLKLPGWWIASAVKPMESYFSDVPARVKERREVLWQVFRAMVDLSAKERARQLAQFTGTQASTPAL